jgi:hypothetical protein
MRAWFRRLIPKSDKLVSNLAINFNLRHYELMRRDVAGTVDAAV